MKILLNLPLIMFLFLFSCGGEKTESEPVTTAEVEATPQSETETTTDFSCEEQNFDSPQAQGDAILIAYQMASDASMENSEEWERKFFCAFPENFEGMVAIFGYQNEEEGPLYNGGTEIVRFFSNLRSIPKDIYYEKYINININADWQADNIRNGFGITGWFEDDPEGIFAAMENRSDDEIESIFRFIYDGPHPENMQGFYDAVLKITSVHSERLTRLNAAAFSRLMAQEHKH